MGCFRQNDWPATFCLEEWGQPDPEPLGCGGGSIISIQPWVLLCLPVSASGWSANFNCVPFFGLCYLGTDLPSEHHLLLPVLLSYRFLSPCSIAVGGRPTFLALKWSHLSHPAAPADRAQKNWTWGVLLFSCLPAPSQSGPVPRDVLFLMFQ